VQSVGPTSITIRLAGSTSDISGVPFLDSYRPALDDVVLVLVQGGAMVVIGKVGATRLRPVEAGDVVAVDNLDRSAVAGTSYKTVSDRAGAWELLSGAIFAIFPGCRITIDGSVVLNITSLAAGRDSLGDGFGVFPVPPCRSKTSIKVEAYNASSSSVDFGARLVWRAA
ncbi:MAG: hypothetical protein ACRDHO_06280, partial [Actinomycetota bacterium]